MELLKLSSDSMDKLLQLSVSLEEIRQKKTEIVESIDPYYKRMNEIELEEKELNSLYEDLFKSKDSIEFKDKLDAKELSDIITKQKSLDEEKESIDIISKSLYEELSQILKQEEEIVSKIRLIDEVNVNSESIYIDALDSDVYIIKSFAKSIDKVEKSLDEIIQCSHLVADEIYKVYDTNATILRSGKTSYESLRELYLANKIENHDELSFLEKNQIVEEPINDKIKTDESTIQTDNIVNKEIVTELPQEKIEREPVVENNQIESIIPKETIPTLNINTDNLSTIVSNTSPMVDIIDEKKITQIEKEKEPISNVVSLDSILNASNIEDSKSNQNQPNVIYLSVLNNEHSKVANTTSDKLENIIRIFSNTFEKPVFKNFEPSTLSNDPITNFLNPNKAA